MKAVPDNTAVRTALWRALHMQIDAPPYILEDDLGLQLVAPAEDWQQRPDMHPEGTRQARISIVTRARFTEDLLAAAIAQGVHQYVILGAGLDTFALRRKDLMEKITVYEIDQPETQAWKQGRLQELGLDIPDRLQFVPIDFEKTSDWLRALQEAGFDPQQPAVISCLGVSMYLSQPAISGLLQQVAALPHHSMLIMTFLVPKEMLDENEQRLLEMAMKGATASGTPFLSLLTPVQILQLATDAGIPDAKVVSGDELTAKYLQGRNDKVYLGNGEQILVANT